MKKKQFLIWVGKKGKTRGRPSLFELMVSAMVSTEFQKHKLQIQNCLNDMMFYGTGRLEILHEQAPAKETK